MKYILCESRLDFKYKMIFSKLDKDFVIIEGGFIKLMKVLIRKKSFYHIRYIKYRGPIITSLKLLIIFVFCKFSQSKIIWSCHNIYEHNFSSKKFNDLLSRPKDILSRFLFILENVLELLHLLSSDIFHRCQIFSLINVSLYFHFFLTTFIIIF